MKANRNQKSCFLAQPAETNPSKIYLNPIRCDRCKYESRLVFDALIVISAIKRRVVIST